MGIYYSLGTKFCGLAYPEKHKIITQQTIVLSQYYHRKVGAVTIDCSAQVLTFLDNLRYQYHQDDSVSFPTDHSKHLNAADADLNFDDDEDDKVTFNIQANDDWFYHI